VINLIEHQKNYWRVFADVVGYEVQIGYDPTLGVPRQPGLLERYIERGLDRFDAARHDNIGMI
jgi:hypothetical protein|tara:strand:- start:585 stop:773 length:189 start_codon:yes stop_codon:yes gene_type:complete